VSPGSDRPEGIRVEVLRVGAREDIALVRIRGFIDTTTAPEVHRVLAELQREGLVNILVDMAGVGYVSSAGWGAFVGEIRDLREKGGDLRVAHMSPEVREVFEMLEFHRIIESYEHVEEAIDDFDLSLGLDITRGVVRRAPESAPETVLAAAPRMEPMTSPQSLTEDMLPIQEKIRRIVIEFPLGGLWHIWKTLRSPRFGHTRINPLRLYRILREMNLETKEKRFRFYRSR
jgi:anti-sigma B factor antagonist